MKQILLLFGLLLLTAACGGNKTAEPMVQADSVADTVATDSVTDKDSVALPDPPLAADGFFDDFAYNFMRSRKFQLSRIVFPLTWTENGKCTKIEKKAWKFDRLYSRAELYTVIFDSEKSVATSSKDTALKEVMVEMLDMKRKSVKQYIFKKMRGAWMLSEVDIHRFSADANSGFLAFLTNFLADADYRKSHIASPFTLVVTDPDTFQPLKGEAYPDQWDIYVPELPRERITNVNYGQKYADSNQRVLLVSSTDGAMTSLITFKKRKGTWLAVKLENN